MNFLFKITQHRVLTLLRGVQFVSNGEKVTLIEEQGTVKLSDIGKIIKDQNNDYVAYESDEKKCRGLQKKIIEKVKGT